MTSARDNVLARVRRSLGRTGGTPPEAIAAAEAYVAAHARGPRPAMSEDVPSRFIARAQDMESTVEAVPSRREIPSRVARYLDSVISNGDAVRAGVCWPEFGDLDWRSAGLEIEARVTLGADTLGITGVFCAIAETGTLVITSGRDTPTATTLLPQTHIAIVSRSRIVACMEDAFALLRRECGAPPRAVNLISGPSRTGDIEQTIVVGAHGPYRVHILVTS